MAHRDDSHFGFDGSSRWEIKTMLGKCISISVALGLLSIPGGSASDARRGRVLARPGLFQPLTEPPCSYASTQNRKNLVRSDDRVIAWMRAAHSGGAIPIRLFLSAPRVINDTYGLFFYDPDGDYVSAFSKDYGYEFYGWRNGIMVARGKDGTLWSALSGMAFEGPQKGKRLKRIPSMVTDWGLWLMLHPESTAYDLYDGKKYPAAPLPTGISAEARETMGQVDSRLPPLAAVLGLEIGDLSRAYPLERTRQRACYRDAPAGKPLAVFWYGPTQTAVAYSAALDGRELSFYADDVSPETAPFKDRETGSRWTLAGRAVDGPLKGKELEWVPGIQCRWYAWAADYPQTSIYSAER